MKKWTAALMLGMLIWLNVGAQAASYTYERNGDIYMTIERFERTLPQGMEGALEQALHADDEILCGTLKRRRFAAHGDEWENSMLLAVRREGKILLMHAGGVGDEIRVSMETDSFLGPEQAFDIRAYPDDEGTLMAHDIVVGDAHFIVSRKNYEGERLWIWRYRREQGDGNTVEMHLLDGHVGWSVTREGEEKDAGYLDAVLPQRLAAWTADAFPRTEEELKAYIAQHQVDLEPDEAYIIGVNLREKPTGKSPSWGSYTARVRILGKEQGTQAPWFHVQVGNLAGWVSGLYLIRDNGMDPSRLMHAAAEMHDVGRALGETALYVMPGGERITPLPEGTLVHVLAENGGWLHVVLPRNGLTWQTDWDGTYGFVRAGDMAVGLSKADALW